MTTDDASTTTDPTITADTTQLTKDIHNAAINKALEVLNSRIAAFHSQSLGIGQNAQYAADRENTHTATAGLIKALLLP